MEINRPTILLTGKNGQVGNELKNRLAFFGSVVAIGREDCDLNDSRAIQRLLDLINPNIIINAAAYTSVDKAEKEPDQAHAINTIAPGIFADYTATTEGSLIHYSTDYVFSGTKTGPYNEEDIPNPLSVYGKTKWEGEQSVRRKCEDYIIIRTSWVYSPHGQNFLKTILRIAGENEFLNVVADQYGTPTSAALIAKVTTQLLKQQLSTSQHKLSGTYHLTAEGHTNWHEYAVFIVKQAEKLGFNLKVKAADILKTHSSSYPTLAKRPLNSCMDCTKIKQALNQPLPLWQNDIMYTLSILSRSKILNT